MNLFQIVYNINPSNGKTKIEMFNMTRRLVNKNNNCFSRRRYDLRVHWWNSKQAQASSFKNPKKIKASAYKIQLQSMSLNQDFFDVDDLVHYKCDMETQKRHLFFSSLLCHILLAKSKWFFLMPRKTVHDWPFPLSIRIRILKKLL